MCQIEEVGSFGVVFVHGMTGLSLGCLVTELDFVQRHT